MTTIEQMHVKHKSYITLVTTKKDDEIKQFTLQGLLKFPYGTRLREGIFSRRRSNINKKRGGGGSFHTTKTHDFKTREEALSFCEEA